MNVYEIYENFDFSILALSDTVLICRHKPSSSPTVNLENAEAASHRLPYPTFRSEGVHNHPHLPPISAPTRAVE
jgi:hypothetical protein